MKENIRNTKGKEESSENTQIYKNICFFVLYV